MAARAPSPSTLDFLATRRTLRQQQPVVLPTRTLGARLRSLLANRSRFHDFLTRESESLLAAARAILHDPAALADPASIPQIEKSLAGAWREEATLTAELCDSAITPLDGEDIRTLASRLTAILEALDDVHAAAFRLDSTTVDWPLNSLCRATLDYIEVLCAAVPQPALLASDPSSLGVLSSRSLAMRTARRACESALLASNNLDDCRALAHLSLLEEFRRLRTLLDTSICQLQRVVLKNS